MINQKGHDRCLYEEKILALDSPIILPDADLDVFLQNIVIITAHRVHL